MLYGCFSYVCLLPGIGKNEQPWKSADLVPTVSAEILACPKYVSTL